MSSEYDINIGIIYRFFEELLPIHTGFTTVRAVQ